ncbi:MAG TPA: class I SAM-dependent methyltransferase [Jiangellales bacterium]|nr:class I SAM-dependent methyltransferase [Jiangellales bacterium]
MKRTECSACGSSDLELFLDLGESPIADAYTATADEESPTYPLQVAVCGKCRLVQLLEVVPAEVLFGTGYSFYSSASAPLSAYHEQYARDVLVGFPELVKRGVVEVGCNDGDLLQHFPWPRIGVDPSSGPAAAAQERGCTVIVEPFGLALAQRLRDQGGRYGVVIANHVLAHVEDVSDFLAGVAHLMDDKSIAMVEVQYLPDLLVNNAFDLVYHEHRNFFSLTSLEAAAGRHGLFPADAELTDRQGGSLRVTLTKRPTWSVRVNTIKRSEEWLNSFGAYEGMQGRAERIRWRLKSLVLQQEGEVVVYGAAAKTTTLLNWTGLTSEHLAYCVDSTPAKQGRHIPGTGIPIRANYTVKSGGITFVMGAWNYAEPIMRANPGHRWILPIPSPMLLDS